MPFSFEAQLVWVGWETARMRAADSVQLDGPVKDNYNWTVFKLKTSGSISLVLIDTFHFKNNHPICFSLEACNAPSMNASNFFDPSFKWTPLIPISLLQGHKEHIFPVSTSESINHGLIKIYPCGGVSRLRLFGKTTS